MWLIYVPWHFPLQNDPNIKGASPIAEQAFQEQYPAIYGHLLSYKEQLSNRNKSETGIRYEWYALQRWGAKYWEEFDRQKIIYPETVQSPSFVIDSNRYMIDKTCFMLISDDVEYLLGTLNSKLFQFAYKRLYSSIELGQNGYQYNKHAFIKLPILKAPQDLINVINRMVVLLQNDSVNENLDKQLNDLIYNIYDISGKEIRFIEESI